MKTNQTIIASSVAALLLVSVTGCKSTSSTASTQTPSAPAVGPATGAAMLSDRKTFDIIGRTGKSITYSKPEEPESDVISQEIRARLAALGYHYQPGSPDFVVSVAWDKYHQTQQPSVSDTQASETTATYATVDKATLAIAVRDTSSGTVLWQGQPSDVVDPHTVTEDTARGLASKALTDFPPAHQYTASN